jgi:hypothetical protein
MLKRIHKNVKIMLNRMLNLTYGLTLFRLIFNTWGLLFWTFTALFTQSTQLSTILFDGCGLKKPKNLTPMGLNPHHDMRRGGLKFLRANFHSVYDCKT